jgi:transposase
MLQLTPQSRIFLATEPVDFRKGIDGLAAVCRLVLREQPFSGAVFVFRNRAATTIKLLCYDGQGFWLSRTVHNAFLSAEDGGDALSVHDAETGPGAHAPDE